MLENYKKDLNEKKINLDDDYIKFIRYGQHFIEKNGEGILAYISNNSFIDGITHRQMRKSLLETFDSIYILDLHGSSKKKETAPDGGKDENVFDIQQGVSINIFVKTNKKKKGKSGKVHHVDCYGKRDSKYTALFGNSISSFNWSQLDYKEPYYFFVQKDFGAEAKYKSYFSVSKLFCLYSNGIETQRDSVTIQFTKKRLEEVIDFIKVNDKAEILKEFDIKKEGRDWKINTVQEDLNSNYEIVDISYRPFDIRKTAYTGNSKGFIAYPRHNVSKHVLSNNNLSLVISRQLSTFDFQHVFVSKFVAERCLLSSQTKETGNVIPLYLYRESDAQMSLDGKQSRTPNLNMDIVNLIADKLGLTFTPEKEGRESAFAPIDILDYIYAVLHSPSYREKYKEFLKIDFPRVPYPEDSKEFWRLVALGGELRRIHLLESPVVEKYITSYPVGGDNKVTTKIGKGDYVVTDKARGIGRVWINDAQYFDGVPAKAWEFYIGGYQPAQKWLKDRKGRELSYDDILHYQKIIVALTETDRIMRAIDAVGSMH